MASLRTYTVELPRPDHSDSSPASCISTAEQSSPIVPYYSSSMPATTAGTTPICSWWLSPSPPLSYPNCSPCCLGLTLQPTPAPFNTSAYNYLPTRMPFRMPASSSVPPANRASPIDAFGAASPGPDFERHNDMQASTSIGLDSACSSPDSLCTLQDQAGASGTNGCDSGSGIRDIKRRRPTPSEPVAEPMTSRTAPVELALATDPSSDVAPRKRSRTAQACEHCRIRKARCFGGNPCNRCIKRKFQCEFTSTRHRGPNKLRSSDLSMQNLNFDSHQQPFTHHDMHQHAHVSVRQGIPPRPAPLARAYTHSHAPSTTPRPRRHSIATGNSTSSMMPAMRSFFSPQPTDTTANSPPHPETPALGLGLELNLNRATAYGKSYRSLGNPSSASLSTINSKVLPWFRYSLDHHTVDLYDAQPHLPRPEPRNDMYTPMMEDEMMFNFSPQSVPGNSDDVHGSYDYPFTPVTPTIPLPLPALGPQSSSEANPAHHETTMATASEPGGDLSFSTARPPRSALNIDDPMLWSIGDHLFNRRAKVIHQLYTSGAGDWRAQQHHPSTPPF